MNENCDTKGGGQCHKMKQGVDSMMHCCFFLFFFFFYVRYLVTSWNTCCWHSELSMEMNEMNFL